MSYVLRAGLCRCFLLIAMFADICSANTTVSGFSVSGDIKGGSSETVQGTITIHRDPGDDGNRDIAIVMSGYGFAVSCPNINGQSGDCEILAGSSSTPVTITAPTTVSQSTTGSLKAYALNYNDPGLTASVTVDPLSVTVTGPGSIRAANAVTGSGETASGTVCIDVPAGGNLTATLSTSPYANMLNMPGSVVIPQNSSCSSSFNITASYRSNDVSGNLVATISTSGSTPFSIIGGDDNNPSPQGPTPNCDKGICGSPINLMNGNVWVSQVDYSLPGIGGGLNITRTWNSLWANNSPVQETGMFGESWRSTYEERLTVTTGTSAQYWRANGDSWKFSWDSVSASYLSTDPPAANANVVFNTTTTLYTLTFHDGSQRIFNNSGYLTQIIDRNGNTATVNYDQFHRITSVVDAANRSVTFSYSGYQVASMSDSTGTIATYTYGGTSPNYTLTKVAYPDGSAINYSYDSSNQLLSVTDGAAHTIETHTYDTKRRGLTSVRGAGADNITLSYLNGTNTQLTDSKSNSTTYNYDFASLSRSMKSISGSGCASCGGRGNNSYTYDASGNLLTSTDPLNRVTTYTYDSQGNILTKSIQLNQTTTLTWSYTYNSLGEVLTSTDSLNHATTNTYDPKGNLLTTATPSPDGTTAGSKTTYGYDAKGQLTTIRDPLNNVTTLTYTAAGLLATIKDAQNNTTTYQYDARGNRTAVIDAQNNTTSFTYDTRNRLTKITYPDQTTAQFAYDGRGRRTSVTDQNGKVTQYAYDDADRLTSITDAQSPTAGVTQFAYDTENNLTSITDALGRQTSFTYDNFGRVTKTTFPSTLYETYGYDAAGNMISKTDRKSQTIQYNYDALDRLTSKQYPDNSTVNYTYDNASRMTQVSDPTGTYGFTFDNMGRLTGTSTQYAFLTGRTFTNGYTYDAASNRTGYTDPEGGTISYVYDTLNRLTSLNSSIAGQFTFGYDTLSRRTSLSRPNGVNTAYSYDNLSRLLSILHQVSATTIDGASYTVDNAGNRTSKTNHLNSTTENYSYDNIYQLKQVTQGTNTTEQYSYDAVGNRLSSLTVATYSYNSSNQLTGSSDAVSYTYDNNGNTLSRTDTNGTTQYAWDFENRLTQVTLPNSGGAVTFKYDPTGRRIQKASASGTTNYVYDGANSIEEVDASGAVLARYAQGPGIDEALAMNRSGATSFYEADGLGSVTSLTNSSGTVANSYTYGAFGSVTNSTGSLQNAYGYTGRELDSETGLVYYRARYYSPTTAHFLSEDPIALARGAQSYSYVHNRPTGLIDPSGQVALIPLPADKIHRLPDIDPYCEITAGGCNKVDYRPDFTCDQDCDGHWKVKFTIRLVGDIYVATGPFPYKGRTPADRSIHDTQTALAHENLHIDDEVNAILPIFSRAEERNFSSLQDCQAAASAAEGEAGTKWNQAREESQRRRH